MSGLYKWLFYLATVRQLKHVEARSEAGVFFFWGMHNVRDELQLSHFVG